MTEPFLTVNMHCHSSVSDGSLGIEELSDYLAANHVQFASLTDHDSIAGLALFHDCCVKNGTGFISGVEISTESPWGELHLLGYGFDFRSPEIASFLSGRQLSKAPYREAIDIIHRCGGKVFMAHPLTVSGSLDSLLQVIAQLKDEGLDGIEALYGPYNGEEKAGLLEIAGRLKMPVSAGTDFHGNPAGSLAGLDSAGERISYQDWKKFRDVIQKGGGSVRDAASAGAGGVAVETASPGHMTAGPGDRPGITIKPGQADDKPRLGGLGYFRIVAPALLAVVLFTVAIFTIIIPGLERSLLFYKQEMIRELTNSAASILEEFEMDARNGLIGQQEARQKAARMIEFIRYGSEHKDYFWITDMQPVMIVHPYRRDLEGKYVGDYIDNAGNKVFMKFVEAVREKKEGYVEYQWQWKDEESRIMSKLSYVKLYEPWGWIIGTGIYMDDLEKEIGRIENSLISFSIIIIAAVSLLLFFLVTESIKSEKAKKKKERDLARSNEKYRTLISATGEGTLIIQDGKCAYSNPKIRSILGYSEDELLLLAINDLIVPESVDARGRFFVESVLHNEMVPAVCETGMRKKDGKFIDVILETDRISFAGREGFIINVRQAEKTERLSHIRDRKKNKIISELQTAILFLSEPVNRIATKAVCCPAKTRIRDAACLMSEKKVSSLFVSTEDGEVLGIVTDHDIRKRVVAEKRSMDEGIYRIMSSPVVSVPENSLIYEAISVMRNSGIRHLAINDFSGNPDLVIRAKELLEFNKYPVAVLTSELSGADTFAQLRKSFSQMPVMMKTLVDTGVKPRNVTRMISSFTDLLTKRIIELAEEELGTPPVHYAFISPGSHGRGEPTLVSDQDNGIIFRGTGSASSDNEAARYLVRLGEIVCRELALAGFQPCRGNIMASNPDWVKPVGEWKKNFERWITMPEPEELLRFNMFFDFRAVFGDMVLARELKEHIKEVLSVNPSFFGHLAQNTLLFKTPIGFMGNIIFNTDDSSNEVFDIKEALMPIVSFARIYALRNGIDQTNTYDRLMQLNEKNIIHESTYNEIENVYDFLMQMRLDAQSSAMDRNLEPGNTVLKSQLTNIETALLKNSLNQIADMQKKITYDFMGGISTV